MCIRILCNSMARLLLLSPCRRLVRMMNKERELDVWASRIGKETARRKFSRFFNFLLMRLRSAWGTRIVETIEEWGWETLTPKIPWDQKLVDYCMVDCVKKKVFFSIFSFRRVNYTFRKLSVNTKYVQFQLCMSMW